MNELNDILDAIRALGDTNAARAERAGVTERTIRNWLAGDVPAEVVRFVEAGILVINPTLLESTTKE